MILLGFVFLYLIRTIIALPVALFLMLFLGNLDLNLSYLACLPGAIVLTSFIDVSTKTNEK